MILDTIAEATALRVTQQKKQIPPKELEEAAIRTAKAQHHCFPFEQALRQWDINFICEVKKASPSKGIIAEDFPYVQIAREYEQAGAAAVSVLTEPQFFLGKDEYLEEIVNAVKIPVLRKDFTIDPYQIYQSKLLGASAVLLICSLLEQPVLKEYLDICQQLGLSALVEAHDEQEIETAADAGARIIGVNNRNLKTFDVDIQNSRKLRTLVPESIIFVAESGIRTADDVQALRDAGVHAVLIGETLMRSPDKQKMLHTLRGNAYD
ncbi:indole-3-glycerol phosphate synthase TrpC [Diplocloster modestus]|uniref:Indole-3-glycerol phosphate synthase n=1 Tax=Diplocloster modestus TaxID=2850322 RepID=A0ABS6K1N2_9FIRM|nr:indole-3-glycerol phosphate synthase TrpC [Diplocloster modestus]MBU9724757.1 indole-3-glycerol phosphate synthase TrpC [Diplocloster modestus]